jgi:hypothetical protein
MNHLCGKCRAIAIVETMTMEELQKLRACKTREDNWKKMLDDEAKKWAQKFQTRAEQLSRESNDIFAAELREVRVNRHRSVVQNMTLIGNVLCQQFRYHALAAAIADVEMPFRDRRQRRYYMKVWYWDPETAKIDHFLPCKFPLSVNKVESWRWEDFFPLTRDPALHAAGVEIGARVNIDRGFTSENLTQRARIVFRKLACNKIVPNCSPSRQKCIKCPDKYYQEKTVDCTHVAVATATTDDLPADQREFAKTTEYAELQLDPAETFVALRSYVQGIAEVGIENMYSAKYPDDPLSMPFGFNSLMQKQVLACLLELCPEAAKNIQMRAIGELLEIAPAEWIKSRARLLNETYYINAAILKEIVDSLPKNSPVRKNARLLVTNDGHRFLEDVAEVVEVDMFVLRGNRLGEFSINE